MKKLSAPGSVEVRRLLFLLFIRTKSISVFSFEYLEEVEPVVVFEEASVGCNVDKFGELSNSKKRPIDSKGESVVSLETNSVFCVESSPKDSEDDVLVKSAGLSKVVSSKLSAGNTRVEVSGLREEGDFPCEFVVAYVL